FAKSSIALAMGSGVINIKQVKMILVIALLVGILGASLAHGETSNEHIQYKKARAIILWCSSK
ncbi:hypothetical protein, partial [Enterobacter bugandensis]|uniref:hypothetical protein n=1 Tax=Enterobacter bugandensis TaxID=881260 RepID=UPI001954ED1A